MTSPLQRDLVYRITADTTGLDKGARAAERQLAALQRRQAMVDRAMTQVGRTMVVAGAAIAGGLALSVKAAIDWESAWAGVLKTVDGTDEQMAALEQEIRSLTGVLPATHAEIAAVAEAAGQLGVRREDISDFTKTMIDMGVATNLSAEEAAFALARMSNIMQTAPEDVRRLASTIVDLGNSSATTEAEITEMALRIAGAGRTIGLSEQQVLGFAAALSSVGIRAQAGGTAISKVFLEIDTAVSAGGESLETFADTAGVSAEEFRQAYERDAGAAVASFVAGLGRVQESGGDVNAVLSQLGLTEVRVSDALRRLAGAGSSLTTSLERSGRAWDENIALTQEAERRYGTVEARLQIARNQVNDLAIDMGQTFLPVLGSVADSLGAFAGMISDLPGPVKVMVGALAAATAVTLLLGGTALVAVPRIHAMSLALDGLAASSARAAAMVGMLRAVTSFLTGGWGLALAAGVTALTAFGISQAKARARVEELSHTLDEQTGAVTDNTRAFVAHELEQKGVLRTAQRLGLDLATLTDAVLGEATALDQVNRVLGEYQTNQALAGQTIDVHSRNLSEQEKRLLAQALAFEDSRRGAEQVRGAVEGLTGDLEAATEASRRQSDAVHGSAAAMDALDPRTRQLATSLGVSAEQAEVLAGQISDLANELKALFDELFAVEAAADALEQQYRRLAEAVEKNGTSIQGNSEAALANREALRALIRESLNYLAALAESGASSEELARETERLKQKFIEAGQEYELAEEAIAQYAAAFDAIPGTVSTTLTIDTSQAQRNLAEFNRRLGLVGPGVAQVRQHGGPIIGPSSPPDRVPVMATGGEFVVRREVAIPNMAALEALNATGRFPIGPTIGGGPATTAGISIENQHLNVTAYSDQFSYKQVMDDLAFRGTV